MNRILIVTVAGLDFAAFQRRAREGALPNLFGLSRRGFATPLVDAIGAEGPADLATLATGVHPERHGIWRWDEAWAGGVRGLTKRAWRFAPLWSRLEAAGIATGSVRWPGIRPGAEWAGCHVDEEFTLSTGRWPEDWAAPRRSVPHLAREALKERRVHITDVTAEMLRPFFPSLDAVDQSRDLHLPALASALAAAGTALGAAAWMLEEASPRPQAVFVHLPVLSRSRHAYEGAAAPFDRMEPTTWRFLDATIGRLAALAGDEAQIIVAGTGWRGRSGLLIAAGRGVAPARVASVARLLDFAPTVLAAFGLHDRDLAGRVLIPSLATQAGREAPLPDMPGPSAPDEDLLKAAEDAGFPRPAPPPAAWEAQRLAELAALQILRDPEMAAATARDALDVDEDNVLAVVIRLRALLMAWRPDLVPPLVDKLRRLAPERGWGAVAEATLRLATDEREAALPLIAEAEADPDPNVRLILALVTLAAGQPSHARRLLEDVVARRPEERGTRLALAIATTETGDLAASEVQLRRLLDEDPVLAPALLELARVLARAGRGGEAELAAQAASALGASMVDVWLARKGRRS